MLFLCNSLWPVLPVLLRLFVASFVEHWSFKSYKCFSPELVKMASEIFFELKTERAASTGSCALTMTPCFISTPTAIICDSCGMLHVCRIDLK